MEPRQITTLRDVDETEEVEDFYVMAPNLYQRYKNSIGKCATEKVGDKFKALSKNALNSGQALALLRKFDKMRSFLNYIFGVSVGNNFLNPLRHERHEQHGFPSSALGVTPIQKRWPVMQSRARLPSAGW